LYTDHGQEGRVPPEKRAIESRTVGGRFVTGIENPSRGFIVVQLISNEVPDLRLRHRQKSQKLRIEIIVVAE